MITSVYKRIHPQTGIIEILVNIEYKWIEYQVNRITEEYRIVMSFYPDCDPVFPPDTEEIIEYIDMKEDFNPSDYMIYHFQDRDQIILFLVPRQMLLDRKQWTEYDL